MRLKVARVILNKGILTETLILVGVFGIFSVLYFGVWFDHKHFPIHDTLAFYETFTIFYSHFFYTHKILEWLPFVNYGTPAYLSNQLIPPIYFVGTVLGSIFQVRDTWLVFKILLFFEIIIYGLGAYFLARELVSKLCAGFFVAILLWTLIIDLNIFFILRPVTFMPFVLLS